MSEQALDVRSAMAVLRRRSRIVAGFGVIGLLGGVGYVVNQPPRMTSTAIVLLPTPPSNSPPPDVVTESRIVTSANILGAAGRRVTPKLTGRQVEKRLEVSAPTTQLIEIAASSPIASQARTLAEAVADQYIQYQRESSAKISTAALADLKDRKTKLQADIRALQTELTAAKARRDKEPASSAAGRKDAQLVAQLTVAQSDSALQLEQVTDRMTTALPDAVPTLSASVMQRATVPVRRSPIGALVSFGLLGFLVGSLLISFVLLIRARRDRRVRLRDEIADSVSSVVLASVQSRAPRSVAAWSVLLQSYQPGPVDQWAYRQLLRALVGEAVHPGGARRGNRLDHPRSLTIITLAADGKALAVGPQLAGFTASMGVHTRLINAVGNQTAASLWAACAADRPGDPRQNLTVGEVRPGEKAEFHVVLAVVDRKNPQFGHSLRTDKVVIAVAAGAATEEELARLAVAIDDEGGQIDGIIVADPDRSDRTTGRLTVEERAKQIALPMRLTGVPAEAGAGQRNGGRR